MSKFDSYIGTARMILKLYTGKVPFGHFIKSFFATNKKYGSRDRKSISSLCYSYFRCGLAIKDLDVGIDKLLLAVFLCETDDSAMLQELLPGYNLSISELLTKKLETIGINAGNLFPFSRQLSPEIESEKFALSFLIQPLLFLRVRPKRQKNLEDALTAADIPYTSIGKDGLSLRNATSLENIIAMNRDAVIQDDSSRQVLNYLEGYLSRNPEISKAAAWDCCVASGGKAILLYDKLEGRVRLTVSDIRENILGNCAKRLQQARVDIYKSFIADLTKARIQGFDEKFQVIVCDVPCTGSGTWSRTPEQLYYFKESLISDYADRQKRIALNSITHLQPKGLFFYITCSVFKKENEDIVAFLTGAHPFKLLQQEYFRGYTKQADTMFVAVLTSE